MAVARLYAVVNGHPHLMVWLEPAEFRRAVRAPMVGVPFVWTMAFGVIYMWPRKAPHISIVREYDRA